MMPAVVKMNEDKPERLDAEPAVQTETVRGDSLDPALMAAILAAIARYEAENGNGNHG